jgi:hypothetical protein
MLWIGIPSALVVGTLRLEHLLATPRFVVPASTGLNALVDLQKIRAETVNRVEGKEIPSNNQDGCSEQHQYGFEGHGRSERSETVIFQKHKRKLSPFFSLNFSSPA